jgi:hypothetical protein
MIASSKIGNKDACGGRQVASFFGTNEIGV